MRTLLIVLTASCLFSAASNYVGPALATIYLIHGIGILLVALLIGRLSRYAPEAVKYGIVLFAIATVSFTLLVSWVVQSREAARRNFTSSKLREYVEHWGEWESLHGSSRQFVEFHRSVNRSTDGPSGDCEGER